MQQTQAISIQQEMLRRRLPVIVILLIAASVMMVVRMITFQFPADPRVASEVESVRQANYGTTEVQTSDRGLIYDRNGERMAVNTLLYRIGISPNLIADPDAAIQQLSSILNRDPLEISEIVRSDTNYRLLANNVEPDVWRQIDQLDFRFSIRPELIPKRYYPQGTLASQIIGFVAGDGDTFRGYIGVEGNYQDQLAGRVRSRTVRNIPTEFQPDNSVLERGSDLVLTIDRDVQFWAETSLRQAVESTGATGGTIIIMNPRNGDILAMTSLPTFDPNNLPLDNPNILQNPAIQAVYEPGSVFKVLTVAAGLEAGVITPNWTYYDQASFQVGSREVWNWDRQAHGETSLQTMLVDSLNVGAATIAVNELGKDEFYRGIIRFGIGARTRVDLEGEEQGILKVPDISPDWSESDLGTNSFGQGVSVTPLQMLTAVNAIANKGVMMRPRVVQQIVNGVEVTNLEPVPLQKAISEQTAKIVTDMMVAVVRDGVDGNAAMDGYSIAGKTGTAEIPLVTGGYSSTQFIMTFVGFLPADDPQVSVLIKLDKPTSGNFASQTAAPVFRQLVERLVIMLEIPTDERRQQLASLGGNVNQIER